MIQFQNSPGMTIQVQNYDPCGCSYTWGYNSLTGQTLEVRIPCVRHITAEAGRDRYLGSGTGPVETR
jgi:hypothetical protein